MGIPITKKYGWNLCQKVSSGLNSIGLPHFSETLQLDRPHLQSNHESAWRYFLVGTPCSQYELGYKQLP